MKPPLLDFFNHTYHTTSARATIQLGRRCAAALQPNDVLLLHGPLGSGKTTFVKGLALGLGITVPVVSPTFVLRKHYTTKSRVLRGLNHIDAYRLETPDELRGLLDEEFTTNGGGVWCIEWARRVSARLPHFQTISVTFALEGREKRSVRVGRRLIALPSRRR